MMGKITLRGLRAHPIRFIATMAAVIFGTAFLGGALVLRQSMATTFEENTTASLRGVDAAVIPDPKRAEVSLDMDPSVPAELVDRVRSESGARAVAPLATGQMSILGADGTVVKPKGTGKLRIEDDALNPYSLSAGRWPERSGEVALDIRTAEQRGIAVGAVLDVATKSGGRKATVVGLVSYLTLGRDGDGPNFIVHADDAFSWLRSGKESYQAILLAAPEGQAASVLQRAQTFAATQNGLIAESGDAYRERQAGAAAGIANALGIGLTAFAYVALFICVFIVYNTFTTVVAQRSRELALLRAVGASAKQIRRAVLLEALVVAVAASAIGFGLGIVLALAIAKAAPGLASAGTGQDIRLSIAPSIPIQVLLTGVVVTLLSAFVPAFRSGRVKPLEALRTAAIDRSSQSRLRAWAGAGATALGLASFVVALVTKRGWFLVPGPGLLFLGLLLGGPKLASWFARIAGPLAGSRRSVSARLAADNLQRNPRRAATTANALVVGVFLVVFVTAAGGALRDFAVDFISQFGGADLNVGSENNTAIPASLGSEIAAVPGVVDITGVYGNFGKAVKDASACTAGAPRGGGGGGGLQFPAAATDPGKAVSALGLEYRGGKPFDQIGPGEAAVGDFSQFMGGGGADSGGGGNAAAMLPKLGDQMTVCFNNGTTRSYKIVTLMKFSFSIPPLLISADDARAVQPDLDLVQYSLKVAPGQVGPVKDRLDQLTNQYSDVLVFEGAFIVNFLKDFFNGLISAVNALLGVAVVVALFGIINTLLLAITERTQEIGLLRAVGMTRTQLRATIRTEAVLVSAMGTLVGVAAGLFVAYCVATSLLNGRGGGFSWPVRELLTICVAGIVVGVLASIVPAIRAARLDVLESVKAE